MSTLFSLNVRDFMRGAVMMVLAATVTIIGTIIKEKGFSFDASDWHLIESASFVAFVTYIIKNFSSDRDGKFLGKV